MRVLVSAWVGSTNAGDELLFRALRDKLQRRGATVAVVSIDPAATRRAHGVDAVTSRNPAAILGAIRRADRVILGGGGLVQDETSHLNVPYHLSRIWLAKLAGTPFAGVGLGAAGLRGRGVAGLVRRSLRGHRGISVRDRPSADLLASIGVSDVQVASDLVFSLPAPTVERRDVIAVCLRSWPRASRALPMSARLRREQAPPEVVRLLAEGLDAIAAGTGLGIRFVALQPGRDDLLHTMIADRMRSDASMVSPEPEGVLHEVGSATAAVTMRYHAGAAAALSGRPAVFLGGSEKLASLAADLGDGAALVPRSRAGLERLPQALESCLGQTDAVVAAVEDLRAAEAGNDRVIDRLLQG